MQRLLRVAFVAFIVVQLTVPVVALAGPRPSRFAWHMFTTTTPAPEAWIEDAAGDLTKVDVRAMLLHPRADASIARGLVERLCADGAAVAVVTEHLGQRSRYPCP